MTAAEKAGALRAILARIPDTEAARARWIEEHHETLRDLGSLPICNLAHPPLIVDRGLVRAARRYTVTGRSTCREELLAALEGYCPDCAAPVACIDGVWNVCDECGWTA